MLCRGDVCCVEGCVCFVEGCVEGCVCCVERCVEGSSVCCVEGCVCCVEAGADSGGSLGSKEPPLAPSNE